jgi:hypothetical protein
MTGGTCLQHHHRDTVGDQVMHLARDLQSLLAEGPLKLCSAPRQ